MSKKSASNLLDELVKEAEVKAKQERKDGTKWTKEEPRRTARSNVGTEPERLNIDHVHTRGPPSEKWTPPEGKGKMLREIAPVNKQIKLIKVETDKAWLKQVHQLLYGHPAKKTQVKSNIWNFSGVTSEHPLNKVQDKLNTWLKEDLQRLSNLFCTGGLKLKKPELIELLLKFIKKPKDPKAGTTPPASPKKTKAAPPSPRRSPPASPKKPKLTPAEKKSLEEKLAEKEYDKHLKQKSAREERAEKAAAAREEKADAAAAEKKLTLEKRAAGEPIEKYKYEPKNKLPKDNKKETKTKPASGSDSPKRRGRPPKAKSDEDSSDSKKAPKRKAADSPKGSPPKKKKTGK